MVTFHAPSDTESYLSVEEETNTAYNAVLPPNVDFEATPATPHVDLARIIELMQARINQLESAQEHKSPPPPPAAPPSPQVKRPRPTQGDPEPYDHTIISPNSSRSSKASCSPNSLSMLQPLADHMNDYGMPLAG